MKIVTHRTSIDFFLTCQTVSRAHDAESNWPILEYLLEKLDDMVEAQDQNPPPINQEQNDQSKMVEQNMHIELKSLPSSESTQPESPLKAIQMGKDTSGIQTAKKPHGIATKVTILNGKISMRKTIKKLTESARTEKLSANTMVLDLSG
ncbi:MAG: hypothetical protein P8Q98_06815 [Candidatus Poseidoniaceae archaeon]|nr:hypothetical protein [Candidatus Poseidoniaceae archaeon]